ncbi:MAG TPA: MFS transporter [Casimicrobiaceae bacterium]|nr:MFS transporter [Casimicrobiaceae bacterium]
MTAAASARRRAFAGLVALGICNHAVLAGARVDVSLDALARGATPATVGVLVALFALLPMLSAVAIGRYSDRLGARTPMIAGSAALALSTALPALWPGYPALFASAASIGFAFTVFQVALQHVTGEMGDPAKRAKRFSHLALAYAVSGMVGPFVAGIAIDHIGHRATFALLALVPIVPFAVLMSGRLPVPAPHVRGSEAVTRGMFDLVRNPTLRRVLAINAVFALAWDVHTMFVPIYGAQLGLSASQIGSVLAVFGFATFLVRVAMPTIVRRSSETRVMAGALFLSAAACLAFPFAGGAAVLALLSFALGFGLGGGQPMVMALLSSRAPPGRMGEAAGLRMSLIQTMSVAVPLAFGALGATIGLVPVFWGVGACLVTGGVVARRGA